MKATYCLPLQLGIYFLDSEISFLREIFIKRLIEKYNRTYIVPKICLRGFLQQYQGETYQRFTIIL
jgi:hypothetical protein